MKLLSLSSNKESFHEIRFNPTGISLILGKQDNPEQSDSQKTYNGVGKSLSIALIHFCLGSSSSDELKEKLPGWEFYLRFEINGKEYISARRTSSQNKVFLNEEEFSLKRFRAKLEELLFDIPKDVPSLSFRPLIKRFVRPNKESYLAFDRVDKKTTDYGNLVINAFLLGLDVDLVAIKYKLRSESEKIRQYRKHLTTDPIFKEFFIGDKKPDLELRDLEDEINRIEQDINVFQVAENYYEVEKGANATKRKLQEAKNQAISIENAISNINESLQIQPDISIEQLQRIFEDANSKLPDSVIRNIAEVENFHSKLIDSRIQRLSKEKIKLERALDEKNKEIASLGSELDTQIKYLGTYRALDELIGLSNHLSSLKTRAQKIHDYKDVLERYEVETQDISMKMLNENRRTMEYLKANEKTINATFDIFRNLAKRFYAERPGGLTIENNDGENQVRFNLDARIQDDTSDGINEVKIFCFDMTNLIGNHNHRIDFIFHDSRLFSNMDPRQRAILFKIAQEYTSDTNAQYIASLNEDQMISMKDQYGKNEFAQILTDNIVLELTDKSHESKLLGVQVDLQYEK